MYAKIKWYRSFRNFVQPPAHAKFFVDLTSFQGESPCLIIRKSAVVLYAYAQIIFRYWLCIIFEYLLGLYSGFNGLKLSKEHEIINMSTDIRLV